MKGLRNMGMGKLFIVSGPSGVGKTTLISAIIPTLQQSYPIAQALTYTTRPARAHEKHGVDYLFIPVEEFQAKIQAQFFLEWSDAYGAYYGSGRDITAACTQGQSRILILNWQGALQVYNQVQDAILIWITVSDKALLHTRLVTRNANSTLEIERRLALATQEIEQEQRENRFKYHVLNDDFEKGHIQLSAILSYELAPFGPAVLKE